MKHQAKLLQDTMATVQKAYFASRPLGNLRVHECSHNAGITIDLYNFEGDVKDVCEGLEFDTIISPDESNIHVKAYCLSYDPDWEEHPLIFLCQDKEEYDIEVLPDNVPDATLANITTWLWNTAKQLEGRSVWMRVGVTVKGTAEEIEALFSAEEHAREVFEKLMKNHQYEIDGNSYIPESCVESYNEEYGTSHPLCDYDVTP